MTSINRAGIAAMVAAALLSGCASSPKKIAAAHISPTKYQSLTCDQVALERTAVEYRAHVLYHDLKKRSNGDKVKMGVGAMLFIPTLFFLKGNGAKAAEYAQMKGDYHALRLTSEDKGCGIAFGDLDTAVEARMAAAELEVAQPAP
jgi:uncharacterized protein YceK